MQRRRVGTFWFAFMGAWALLLTLFGAAGLPQAASADPGDPVFELQGEWAPDTPSTVDTEEVVSSTWWFNINNESKEDHDNRPSNDPLDNVTLTLHSTNAVFDEIPNICLTNDVDPVSDITISSDGEDSTLTCNVGTQDLGTAIKLIAAMSVTGSNDDEVSVTGEFPEGENTVTLDPLTIDNSLFMDLVLVDNADKKPVEGSNRKIFYNWTLYHGKHSPAGPDSVTYTVRVTSHATNDDLPQVNQAVGCQPFTSGGAVAHPWSGGSHPNDQLTAFPTCSLQQISSDPSAGVTTYELTLSNIDYSHAQIPSKDSTGADLPSDLVAIAGGELEFQILTDAPLGSTTIEVDPVTYTAPSGHTAEDDPSNNTSANTWTSGLLGGGWLTGNVADTMRVTPGDEVISSINMQMRNWNQDFNDELGFCMVLDTKYTEFSSLIFDDYNHNEESLLDRPGVVVQYYTAGGFNGELNPNNSNYNPNAAVGGYRSAATRVCSMDSGSTNWSTTKPADSDIRAVRVLFTPNDVDPATSRPHFKVTQRIKEDVDIGQDIWVWIDSKRHQPGRDDWSGNAPQVGYNNISRAHSMDPADKHARGVHTPDARYPHTGTGRDIIRVVGARPVLDKSAGESTILPGDTVTYNVDLALESLASGDSTADLVLTDTLPAGASYVANTTQFSPSMGAGEPAISGQTLTWTVPPGVPFNQSYTLTYDVVFDGDPQTELVGGKQLKNTIEADYLSLEDSSSATVAVNEAGLTSIIKSAGSDLIPRQGPDALTNEWTIKVISEDPSVSAFTDTIDVLPYDGDNRGTSFNGSYTISPVQAPGATVYYTSEDPSTLSDDPAHPSNGAPNAPSGIWSTSYSPDATAVRVIGGTLLPSATFEYSIPFEVEDFEYGDTLGNRAQGIAENTRLVMRTSAETTLAPDVSAELQKYVLDRGGDPNNEADWIKGDHVEEAPRYAIGEQVWYRIAVTNTGDLPLTDIEITDDLFPQGNTTIAGPLAPGATAEHVFDVTLEADTSTITDGSYPGTCEVDGWDESMTDTVVNHAWASAKDSDDNDVEIPCDPTIIKNPGEPTHDKQLLDAAPIGDGQWEVTYRITVENTSDRDATYDLHDELRFADEVTVISAQISDSPSQVTLYDPAWDGQANQVIAANAKLLANDHADYAPHEYDITVIAEIPLFIDTSGEVDPTECADPSGEPTSTALTNTSTLTKPDDDTEEDWACAPIPSLDISKSLTDGPTLGTDGDWEVTYEIVVTNHGSVEHTYDLHDQLRYGGALEVLTADVDGPSGVDVNSGWTGLGADLDAPENLIADGVDLGADETHTFTVTVTAEIDDAQADLSTVECPPPGSAENGGFANSAQLGANDQAAVDEDCASIELDGEVIWNKVDINDSFLAGSEWMLEGPGGAEILVTDCVADTPADCAAEVDVDHRPGQFRVTGLAWGEWTLVETTAPAGFLLDDTEHPFELTLVNNQVSVDLGDMINEQRPPTTLPLTGGVSQLAVLLTGTGILALTFGLGVAQHLRRRR